MAWHETQSPGRPVTVVGLARPMAVAKAAAFGAESCSTLFLWKGASVSHIALAMGLWHLKQVVGPLIPCARAGEATKSIGTSRPRTRAAENA